MTATSGSKLEYGPYTAEFAPVTAGTWTVAVPSLGATIDVVADNYNLVVIEFVQIPAPVATQTAQPTSTATPLAGELWEGRVVREEAGAGVTFARLLVKVMGRNGQPVQLSTPVEFINTALTGQKPRELGPNMVEFTGLTPGKYIIEPLGLGTRLEVTLKANIVTRVEFDQKTSHLNPDGNVITANGHPNPGSTYKHANAHCDLDDNPQQPCRQILPHPPHPQHQQRRAPRPPRQPWLPHQPRLPVGLGP